MSNEVTTTNALSNPDSYVKVDGEENNPVTSAAVNQYDSDIKEEDGVEVEEINDGDVLGTGEDLNGAFDDDDEEDDDIYDSGEDDDDDDDEEYISA